MSSKDIPDSSEKVHNLLIRKDLLFSSLMEITDKDTLKWVLVKFLKDSLDFLSSNEEARKTKRGKLVEDWIDENIPDLPGNYDS